MLSMRRNDTPSVCPKTGKSLERIRAGRWSIWAFACAGFLSLIWFLVRVVPKPSRALYPCQRLAFPLASTFVVWLAGIFGSVTAFRKAKRSLAQSRYVLCAALFVVAVGSIWGAQTLTMEETVQADDLIANSPVGIAKGVNPGRVAWAHDPDATDWDGPGDGHWWEPEHTSQPSVDKMMDRAIHALADDTDSAAAWDKLFKHFNQVCGKGNVGYTAGEKIAIKVNFVSCMEVWSRREPTEPRRYNLRNADYMNTSPQMITAVLRHLVKHAGVNQADITVGDPIGYFPNEYYAICTAKFPNVQYLAYTGKFGRRHSKSSSVPLYWSTPAAAELNTEHLPVCYAEAAYMINLATLKSHNDFAGVTLCAKNHYGSLLRTPIEADGFYDMHKDLPYPTPGMGHYRPLVDLMGHDHLGGKTVLYVIDGLYGGKHAKERSPRIWNSAPFNGDWPSSLLLSQDPVAIDSVGFDFLYAEWDDAPHKSGTTDYLVEAALADNPPSGTFYDPNHKGNEVRLKSLGVQEHWNNPQEKQYSRNLGTGKGIELVKLTGARGSMPAN